MFQIFVGNTQYNKSREYQVDNNGYVPLTNICRGNVIEDNSNNLYDLDSVKIRYFESFIADCNRNNIKLFVFFSPYFIKYKYEDRSLDIAKKIARKNNVTYYDFGKDSIFFKDLQLFADESHLNDKGAKLYTNKVIEIIKKYNSIFTGNTELENISTPRYSMIK